MLINEYKTSKVSPLGAAGYELGVIGVDYLLDQTMKLWGSCNHRFLFHITYRKRQFNQPHLLVSHQWRKWCIDDAKNPIVPASLCPQRAANMRNQVSYRLLQSNLQGGVQPVVLDRDYVGSYNHRRLLFHYEAHGNRPASFT